MSVMTDLARNRSVFAALNSGERAPFAETPSPALPEWRGLPRLAEPPAPAARAFPTERGEPASAEEPRRVIHTLGTIPEARYEPMTSPETALRYPEPASAKSNGRGDDGLVADDTYRTLLRRFDQDARQGSQLAGEEEL